MFDATAVLDGLGDGVLVFDADRICVYANDAAARFLEVATDVPLGLAIHTVLRRDALDEACRRVEQSGAPETYDEERLDGHCYRFRVTPWADGVVIFLRELGGAPSPPTAPGLLEQVIAYAPVGVTVTGLDGRLRLANRFASTWVGTTTRSAVGQRLADHVSPGLAATVTAAEERVRRTRLPELATSWSYPRRGEPALLEIAVFAVYEDDVLTGTGAIYNDVTRHERAEQALRDSVEERRRLVERVVDAEERERTRIAADIHDDSLQALAAVGVRLAALARAVEADSAGTVGAVRDTLGAAMSRLRTLLFDLEPTGADASLLAGIRAAAEFVLAPAGVGWTVTDNGVDLPYAERVIAVRIAVEALSNVRAHARAGHVSVHAQPAERGVEITVADDGVGVDPDGVRSGPGHRGVTTMHDRATLAGGWVRIERGTPRGTTVRYWLPDHR